MENVQEQLQEILEKSAQRNAFQNTPPISDRCRSCSNTGYIGWKTPHAGYTLKECAFCECEIGQKVLDYWRVRAAKEGQKTLSAAFANAGIPEHFRDFTIESLIERSLGDKGKAEAIAAVSGYVENGYILDAATNRYKFGLVLSGDFGRGKTGLLTPVLRHMVAQGKTGLWIEMYDFLISVQSGYEDGSSLAKLEAAQRADVILLDDFGDKSRTQPETDDRKRILYQLVNYRHNAGLPMLITTNLTAAEIGVQFGQRIAERILESCAWVKVSGENLRFAPLAKARKLL